MQAKRCSAGVVVACLLFASLCLFFRANAEDKLVAFYSPPAGGGAFTLVAGMVAVSNRFMGGGYLFVHEQTTGGMEVTRRLMAAEGRNKEAFGSFGATDGYNAYKGRVQYAGNPFPGIRAIVHNQMTDLILAVPANSPIKTYYDVKGKRIGMGGPGSTVATTAHITLDAYGVKKQDFKPYYFNNKDNIEGIQDGSLDGAFFAGGSPIAAVVELATRKAARIVPVDEKIANEITSAQPGYFTRILPGKTYKGVDQDTRIMGWSGVIFTHARTSDDLVYRWLKNLFDHKEDYFAIHTEARALTLKDYNKDVMIPFHPGAEKYFKEMRVWKEQ